MKNIILALIIGAGAYYGLPAIALTGPVQFGLGLIVGWNILQQPEWIAAIYQKVADKVAEIRSGI